MRQVSAVTLPFTEYLTQYLRIIKKPDRALKDIFLSYLED